MSIEAKLQLAELYFQRTALAQDLEVGRVPADARRGLFAFELASGIDYVALASGVEAAVAEILRLLGDQRARFLALLRADLAATGSADAVVRRLQEAQGLGIRSVPGAAEMLIGAEAELTPLVNRLATEGAAQVVREAGRQGVTIGAGEIATDAVSRHLRRLIDNPNTDALRAVTDAALQTPPGASIDVALGITDQAGRALSAGPLEDLARSGAYSLNSLGRQSPPVPGGTRIYASELLDVNTCGWCRRNDGRQYDTEAEAYADYPLGAYRMCEGGLRCRGTLVRVYEEAGP